MYKRLGRGFFERPTLTVSKDLLGKFLVRKIGKQVLVGKIVETEAYIGPEDRASHAFGGKLTARNRAEWMIGGHVYIYLVYGMHFQFNISTGKSGVPECVLIRAVEPAPHPSPLPQGEESRRANGPGKLCEWMKLDKSFYSEDVTKSSRLWVEDRGMRVPRSQIIAGPRVGIDYAGPYWSKIPWRFYIKGNPAVSKPHL